jgi:DNA-binding beta-propeller fold protein YncE
MWQWLSYAFLLCIVFRASLIQLRGEFVSATGSQGAGLGQFNYPSGLALSSNENFLLIAEYGNCRVAVADARDGRSVRTLQGDAGTLLGPVAVAMVPRTGQLLVADINRHCVVVFAGVDDDTVVRIIGDGQGTGPRQLRFSGGVAVLDDGDAAERPVAVISDCLNHRLSLFRVDDGALLRHLGSEGSSPRQFHYPTAVAVASASVTRSGEAWLVVGDSSNHRVQVLTLLGVVMRVLVADYGVGLHVGWLGGVTVCAATGEVLVTDMHNHRVVSWRLADGGGCRVVCGSGVRGSDAGQFNEVRGIVVTSSGIIWVADVSNHRLCEFR